MPATTSKKAPKKSTKKASKKEATPRGDSIRLRVFQLLAKHADGLTGATIQEKLSLSGIPSLLKDEGMRSKAPRIERKVVEGVRGVHYVLTAAGKTALKDGTVDSEAAPKAEGDWPSNR